MVYRIFVEKKKELAHEANSLYSELKNLLGISSLTSVRILNRYDVENISEQLFEDTIGSVFSEPQLDIATRELKDAEGTVFAVEYLPGQFDQRADSAAQCIQIVSCGDRPLIRTAKVYVLGGELSAEDVAEIKSTLLTPLKRERRALICPKLSSWNMISPPKLLLSAAFAKRLTTSLPI